MSLVPVMCSDGATVLMPEDKWWSTVMLNAAAQGVCGECEFRFEDCRCPVRESERV